MSERRVLYIVEGESTEVLFLKRLQTVLIGTPPGNVFSYGGSLHNLLNRLSKEGNLDDIDVLAVLREDADDRGRDILSKEYSDVYLVFDMDPQDDLYNDRMLMRAMTHFDDSTVNGKLYLNYPMMESYKHLKEPYDSDYANLKVTKDEIKGYKALVGKTSYITHISDLDEKTLDMIIRMNVAKAGDLQGKGFRLPSKDDYLRWSMADILSIQTHSLRTSGTLSVLNTSVLNAVDFEPGRYLGDSSVPLSKIYMSGEGADAEVNMKK